MQIFIVLATVFIVLGRFTIPGHGLTGWPGFYEAITHILLGALIALAVKDSDWRWFIIALVVAMTMFEIMMFKLR